MSDEPTTASVTSTLKRSGAISKGEVVAPPEARGNRRVATFRDPAGNVMGLWHDRPR